MVFCRNKFPFAIANLIQNITPP